MIALPPVDPADFIMKAGDEMRKCIDKYFNEVSLEEAANPEILDQKFAPELLGTLQAEYYRKLENVWGSIPAYRSSFEAAYKMPPLQAAGDLDALQKAYEAAVKRSFWEKLGKTNYKDVAAYKTLLKEYGEALLSAMHGNFVDAVAKLWY